MTWVLSTLATTQGTPPPGVRGRHFGTLGRWKQGTGYPSITGQKVDTLSGSQGTDGRP